MAEQNIGGISVETGGESEAPQRDHVDPDSTSLDHRSFKRVEVDKVYRATGYGSPPVVKQFTPKVTHSPAVEEENKITAQRLASVRAREAKIAVAKAMKAEQGLQNDPGVVRHTHDVVTYVKQHEDDYPLLNEFGQQHLAAQVQRAYYLNKREEIGIDQAARIAEELYQATNQRANARMAKKYGGK